MSAAVADFRPARAAARKIKKTAESAAPEIVLERTPDILAGLRDVPIVKIGFAAETDDLLANARQKLAAKGLAMIVANDAVATIGARDSTATFLYADGRVEEQPQQAKEALAERILDQLVALLGAAERFCGSVVLPAKQRARLFSGADSYATIFGGGGDEMNKSVHKNEFIKAVAERANVTQADASRVVTAALKLIAPDAAGGRQGRPDRVRHLRDAPAERPQGDQPADAQTDYNKLIGDAGLHREFDVQGAGQSDRQEVREGPRCRVSHARCSAA